MGDPHLTSLDGLSFTFNGHGEFVLLKATNVEVQGRFSPQRNAAGVKSATFISGIAGQQSSPASDKVEFRLDANSNNTGTKKIFLILGITITRVAKKKIASVLNFHKYYIKMSFPNHFEKNIYNNQFVIILK